MRLPLMRTDMLKNIIRVIAEAYHLIKTNWKESTSSIITQKVDGEIYQWKKTQYFKRNEFVSSIHNIKVRDENNDKDLDKWLRSNQRKFGYQYSFTPARNKPE